jgi:hypothetical protein
MNHDDSERFGEIGKGLIKPFARPLPLRPTRRQVQSGDPRNRPRLSGGEVGHVSPLRAGIACAGFCRGPLDVGC